jgi:hypothetical protein
VVAALEVLAHAGLVAQEVAGPDQQVVEVGAALAAALALEAGGELLDQGEDAGERLGAEVRLQRPEPLSSARPQRISRSICAASQLCS